jgi:hypothetical protein
MLRLQKTTGRTQSITPLLQIPLEVLELHLFPYLPPAQVWNISVLCLGTRITVATATNYWKQVNRQGKLPNRTSHKQPFFDWTNKERSYALVSVAWKRLKQCLTTLQRTSLLPPVALPVLLQVETQLNIRFPLDLVMSFIYFHNGQSTTRRHGTQLTDDFFMIPVLDMCVVQQTQLERRLPQHYIPVFVDSSHQQLICCDARRQGTIVKWSPCTEHYCAKRWSLFLEPE